MLQYRVKNVQDRLLYNDEFTDNEDIEISNLVLLSQWIDLKRDAIANSIDSYDNEYLGI